MLWDYDKHAFDRGEARLLHSNRERFYKWSWNYGS
jgi:hypothetical protein